MYSQTKLTGSVNLQIHLKTSAHFIGRTLDTFVLCTLATPTEAGKIEHMHNERRSTRLQAAVSYLNGWLEMRVAICRLATSIREA